MGTDDHIAKVLNLDKRLTNRENLAALSNAARSKRGRKEKKERFNLIPLLRPSAAPISDLSRRLSALAGLRLWGTF